MFFDIGTISKIIALNEQGLVRILSDTSLLNIIFKLLPVILPLMFNESRYLNEKYRESLWILICVNKFSKYS